jgi:Na+-transporting NADH:ubiquinone oxidoreductase subunit NqrD
MLELFKTHAPNNEINLATSVIKATSNLKVPARLFIVSDFLYPIDQVQRALEYATSKNFEVALIIIDTLDE